MRALGDSVVLPRHMAFAAKAPRPVRKCLGMLGALAV